ncbi:MAG: hypothetical protein IJU76_04205 [Desulfovibrionaceae bacterium]|nr:hypothetical protein [Desulfovibrionaceae bacterium]
MNKVLLSLCLVAAVFVSGCAQSKSGQSMFSAFGGSADVFNPWLNDKLPTSRQLSKDGTTILGSIGGGAQSIQGETRHRPHWKDEVYPIVFGSRTAAHEILVLLDFANPASETLWKEVVNASSRLSPNDVKIVVFGKNSELYGTDLTGLLIWIVHERKGQAMAYLSYALARWNEVKAAQKRQGRVKVFANEYDSTAKTSDLPIHYGCMSRLNPPVRSQDELALSRYNYDAGNINMYQATQVSSYYSAEPPCVIVDGKVLGSARSAEILNALRK